MTIGTASRAPARGIAAGRGMRVSLFITCFNDTIFPQDRPGGGPPARAARALGRVPDGADLLRPDALQHGLPARGDPAGPAVRRGLRVGRGRRLVPQRPAWGWSVTCIRTRPSWLGDAQLARAVAASIAPKVFELSEFLVNKLGIEDVGAYYPTPGDVSSDLPLACGCSGWGTLRSGCSGPSEGSTSSSFPKPRSAAGSAGRSRSRMRIPRWRCSATRSAGSSRPGPRSASRPTTRA